VVWASLAGGIPILVSLLSRMDTVDLAYQLRAGNDVLAGSIPRVDTYTFTSGGAAWLDQQWLAQGAIAAVFRAGGWASLAALQAALIGLTFWLLFAAVRSGGAPPRTASLLTTGGFLVASPGLALRPQLLALPLFAGLLLVVAQRERHPPGLWLAPVLTLLCANVHGSFALFVLIVGLAWLEDRRLRAPRANRTLLITGITAATTIVTPFGPRVWSYVYDVSTNPVIRDTITEWAPLTLGSAAGWLAVASFLGTVGYLLRRRTPTPWTAQLTLALFFLLALSAQRALVWWAMVAPVVVGALIGTDRDAAEEPSAEQPSAEVGRARSDRLAAYVMISVLIVAIVALLPWWRGDDPGRFLRDAPAGVSAAAASLPSGTKLLAYQPWASWLEYTEPHDPVFVDSRVEVVPEAAWDDYAKVASGNEAWSDILDRWGVDAIAGPNDWAPIQLLDAAGSGWRVVYRDDQGTIVTRV
jgi:hypothetical protein